jgi:flagellar FliJ protein
MTRAQRLQPVQRLADETERRLAQSLAAFERRVAEAEAKLSELTRYRQEYENQFSVRAGFGISAPELRDYQAFLARLTEAIRQQGSVVQRARIERDLERTRWQDAAKRAKAVDHVIERWQNEERRALDRRDQRESDERAQRKVQQPL